jgi:putative lipoic acid-binding regulatory protein
MALFGVVDVTSYTRFRGRDGHPTAPALGNAIPDPHNPLMTIKSDNPDHGFQFPGEFEITVMGPADAGLENEVPNLLAAAGVTVVQGSLTLRPSRAGNYVSVRLAFHAVSRGQYETAHEAVREHPQVKWTL